MTQKPLKKISFVAHQKPWALQLNNISLGLSFGEWWLRLLQFS